MKSKKEQLESRGFIPDQFEADYRHLDFAAIKELLYSPIPCDRTLAARLIKDKAPDASILLLCEAFGNEKKLYTKLEICSSLVHFGDQSIKPLIKLLGKIGNNQHKEVPKTIFKKNSYPLPRDIAARTLIRFGKNALPALLTFIRNADNKALSEAIDAIGFINYYDYSSEVFPVLKTCFLQNTDNELITFKIIRAFSSCPESISFLNEVKGTFQNQRLVNETERSLKLSSKE